DRARVLALGHRPGHLFRRLDVELVAREPHAVLARDHLLRLDREQHVVGVRVLAPDVVAVVGGDHADAVPVGELAQHRVQSLLLLEPVVLDLDEEVLPEDVEVLLEKPLALLGPEVEDGARDLGAEAAGERDHALRVLAEQLEVDTRLHVEALEVGAAREAAEVLVTLEVLREEREVVVAAVELRRTAALLEARAGRDVGLEPDDGLDAVGDAGPVELDGPVHVAVVRHGHGGVVGGDLLDPLHQLADARGPVQEAVSGVLMEVREALHLAGHGASLSRSRAAARRRGGAARNAVCDGCGGGAAPAAVPPAGGRATRAQAAATRAAARRSARSPARPRAAATSAAARSPERTAPSM